MATIGTGGIDSNPYARLGLAPGASIADVKRAYRRLAMHFHPDHAGPGSLPTFMAVKTAYEWIVAHQPHAEFDHRRSGRASGPTVARSFRDAPPEATQPAPAPVNRSTWHGGRWYWEGMRARAARQPSPT